MIKNLTKILGYIAAVPFAFGLVMMILFIVAPLTMISRVCGSEFREAFNDSIQQTTNPLLVLIERLSK